MRAATYNFGTFLVVGPILDGFDDIIYSNDDGAVYPPPDPASTTCVAIPGNKFSHEIIHYQDRSHFDKFVIETTNCMPERTIIGPPSTYDECFACIMRDAYNEYQLNSSSTTVRKVFALSNIVAYAVSTGLGK